MIRQLEHARRGEAAENEELSQQLIGDYAGRGEFFTNDIRSRRARYVTA
jgi:hypothetical protein